MVILIYTPSIEYEFPISPHLGVLRLLAFCQPLKQCLKSIMIFISLIPHKVQYVFIFLLAIWGFSSVICLFVTVVHCSVRLFAFCCYCCFNSLSVVCIAGILFCSVPCLFTLCFLCLLCFKKSFPASQSHKNGLPYFF